MFADTIGHGGAAASRHVTARAALHRGRDTPMTSPARRIAMTAAFVALSLGLAISSTGQGAGNAPPSAPYYVPQPTSPNGPQTVPYYYPYQRKISRHHRDYILPPGPGDGWGFPNGFPDGYGWFDHSPYLPLGPDRTAEYYFPRYHVVPPEQMFFPTYYNPYETRGQRYLPYVADGGAHPAGGAPPGPSDLPVRPYASMPGSQPFVTVPRLNGRSEATFVPSGTSGLTP
jgi:hypothetical protein